MKHLLQRLCVSLLLFCPMALLAQLKVSVMGDSYSTYEGYMSPSTNLSWYAGKDGREGAKRNDVKLVEQTWWHLLTSDPAYTLERNNSYSGSTICHTGYRKEDFSDRSFITRVHNLGQPDIILVFGGTNDSWAKSPIGDYQHFGWTKADLMSFRPAFCYLLHQLRELYPGVRIVNITNTLLSAEVTESMAEVCRHYQVENILLHDIDKQAGHPSIQGMQSICQQVKAVLDQPGPKAR